MRKRIFILLLVLLLSLSACGTEPTQPTVTEPTVTTPSQPKYEYAVVQETFFNPSMVRTTMEREVFRATTKYGDAFVFASHWQEAERFLNLQTALLDYLNSSGILISDRTYIGTDYNGSFSVETRGEVYISLNDMGTWKQILATLQGVWGDYTDYGYLYAISNEMAMELGWFTDEHPPINENKLHAYFAVSSYALDLHYPSFTERYASEETVNCCKNLSLMLLNKLDWPAMIGQSIGVQLAAYRELIEDYASDLQIDYVEQQAAYSFYAEQIPLRIRTEYAVMLVEESYTEPYEEVYGSYFSNDRLIYQTATELTAQMSDAVSYVELDGDVEPFTLYWMSQQSGKEKYGDDYFRIKNNWTMNTAYVGTIYFTMHAYYRHLEHMLTGTTSNKWQSMAFVEIGNFRHPYARMQNDYICTEQVEYVELFRQHTGREYSIGSDDCYIIQDILAYINGSKVGDAPSSVSCARYLMEELGEKAVMELLLNPKQAEAVAGRNWTSIEKEWKQHLEDFFASQTQ